VITTAVLAVAELGTLVLDGSARQARCALSLVPEYHLCVVGEPHEEPVARPRQATN